MKTIRFLVTIASTALAAFIHPAIAAPGDLDLTFGGAGKVITDISSGTDRGYNVALQDDGKIVVAGVSGSSFAVLRYNADGTLDPSFNGTGKVTTAIGGGAVAQCIVVQPDGRIVVAGYSVVSGNNWDFAVVRYNTDGSLDTSFNSTGKVTTSIGGQDAGKSVALQSDGKIVVAGWSITGNTGSSTDFAIVRYNANGSLDASFNGTGKVTTDFANSQDQAYSVAVESDQKIVVAGYSNVGSTLSSSDFAVMRLNADGSLDASFNGTGKVTTDFGSQAEGRSVATQQDGRIIVAGLSSNGSTYDFALVRYNVDGSPDTSFNGTGNLTTAIGGLAVGQSVAIQSDGKIVAAGYSLNANTDFLLIRYNVDGSLDSSFGNLGLVTTDFGGNDEGYGLAIQTDARIVVAGYSTISTFNDGIALARYEGGIAVPEPSTFALIGLVISTLAGTSRPRRDRSNLKSILNV